MEEAQFKCFRCEQRYNGRPIEHVCPDGVTYHMRTAKREKAVAYSRYDVLDLTQEDKDLLKGMLINYD